MAGIPNDVVAPDGSLDFSGGIDSQRVPTIQSATNPNGIGRNQLCWLINGSVRNSGITPRTGWTLLGQIGDGTALYQGGFLYEPPSGENPYFYFSIGGRQLKVLPDLPTPIDLSTAFGLVNPADQPQAFFVQGEDFLITQAGDYSTKPLFWDDTTLRRSMGITNINAPAGTPGVNELPAAGPMDYYMGRIWYAQGRNYSAGDLVKGQSGTLAYKFRDAILSVTENPLVLNGDGFAVPDQSGSIRALFHNAQLNSVLGQGQLLIGTRKAIYALDVPVSRADWTSADVNNQPKQTPVQLVNGPVGDRCIVKANGDVFYAALEPSIRSLFSAVRNFNQWGNVSISTEENRLWSFQDRALMATTSGIVFDNRLWMTALPKTTPQGTVFQAIVPMDFTPINRMNSTLSPVWEGMYEGLQFLQLFAGDFGGRERAFATAVNATTGAIELWELTDYLRTNQNSTGELRTTMVIEFPAFTWGDEFALKRLQAAELWIDKIYGEVIFKMEYRPDQDPCWKLWHAWKDCVARNSCEDVYNPICYPLTTYRESFQATATLPEPREICQAISGRPSNVLYQAQCRLTVTGWARIRGLQLWAERRGRQLWQNMVC